MGIFSGILAACAGERPNNIGEHGGALSACPSSPNCVSSQSTDQRHFITPISFSGDADSAFNRMKLILQKRTDTTLIVQKHDYLQVEFRTRIGFIDDGEFLLDREQSCIQLRSAARLGYYDMGKNRSRLEELRHLFIGADGKK